MKSDNESRNGRVEDAKGVLDFAGGVGKKTPEESIVQRSIAQLEWRYNICLMEKAKKPNRRQAYAMVA
jgi:hypothetical protein